MNRMLQYLNFLGVFLLSLLCASQWKTNSSLAADLIAMHKQSDEQSATITTEAGTIKEDAADLDDYRQRLDAAETELKQLHSDLTKARSERDQATAERNQLKETLDKFVAALKVRDQSISQLTDVAHKQDESIHQLEAVRDDAIKKYNDLVTKFNAQKQQ